MRVVAAILLLLSVFAPAAALAVEPGEILANPVLEARARAITSQLRCLVCQNESIDESQAPLAKDLRLLVRRRLVAGDSNRQIFNYLVARYGDFILLKPPFEPQTLLLWFAPAIALAGGGFAAWRAHRRSKARAADDGPPLSEAERIRLASMLDPEPARGSSDSS